MDAPLQSVVSAISEKGYAVIPAALSPEKVAVTVAQLTAALESDLQGSSLRSATGTLYAARNILQLWPAVTEVWQVPPLTQLLPHVLGSDYGLVRVLFFDKPPTQSWALPWHKDFAIAVKNNQLPSSHFSKPTTKAGVQHVEAPEWLLQKMLSLRLHLDDVTLENGPLKVLPGSHRGDESQPAKTILAKAGDVLAIRPLVSHCSNKSHPDTTRHRRLLHMEFAGVRELPDDYAWHDFIPFV
ncbi:MAG: phytanoyl-CoA dioxygenase family protein [Planctomycetes bacterium]|nr:phytanoyl-CoA dioxygenase family protein [Planctomycetota bacterium]